ncbi:tetratricopeptide repeat protein 8-like [Pollicipes pollicipes]|uniref:tetratricopeptide repeat protein 8-like n=1 Tax=Pollicipes pollicipes TaxID=41117 RepID=UPI0018853AFD|nr:tetratricopeptide repeat protein 8-like [Pollicipes pollicipes]
MRGKLAAWTLKARALTQQVYMDDIEADEDGIADTVMDDNAIAQVARPGTSLKTPGTQRGGTSQAFRPTSQSGRPISGMVRPGTQSAPPGTMEQALRTARTSRTARPISASSGRTVRIGTASMLSSPDGPFINLARLNLAKYAKEPTVAKPLFEYILYHENDIRHACDLASQATQAAEYKDWWWKVALGKCYYRLGMFREAEKQFKSALKQQPMVASLLHLCRVYTRLDQPIAALNVFRQGLDSFPGEVSLLTGIARIYEGLNDITRAAKYYRDVLQHDATSVESIACIGLNHFYGDQPEVALRFYRRLLQMGIYNAEIFNNLGLCCFYAQQYDMTLTCFQRALSLADDQTAGDVWYNVGHVALGIADINLAYQCFRLALVSNHDHAEAYNNLGVLEQQQGRPEKARAFFQAAAALAPHMFEPLYNHAALSEKMGDLQSSYIIIKKALEAFPEHVDSTRLFEKLQESFSSV